MLFVIKIPKIYYEREVMKGSYEREVMKGML